MNLRRDGFRITFIISVYNGLDYTRNCLESLRHTVELRPHEVIIVDDTSTDGTREFLTTLTPSVRVVLNDHKCSYAANNNAAARLATGNLLCLLNNDLILRPGWLEPMLHAFELFSDAGIIGNAQRNPRTGRYDHLGMVFDDGGVPWHYGKHFFFNPHRGYTSWRSITAACCLMRRSLFLEAGGFDEAYINGSEDIDLCLRLGQRGYRHYVANESVVEHCVSSSPGRHTHNEKNQTLLLQRWRNVVMASLTRRDRRLYAANYIFRELTRPWRYNGPRLARAISLLAFPGR